jgi:hypothetical protein
MNKLAANEFHGDARTQHSRPYLPANLEVSTKMWLSPCESLEDLE